MSTTSELFGVNLHLELNYSCLDLDAHPSTKINAFPISLHVQGLPENMLDNKPVLSQALECYFKNTTGYEISNCVIEHGAGLLTFTDPSGEYY